MDGDVAVVAAYRDQHGIPDHVAQPIIPPNEGNAVLAVRRSWLRLQPVNDGVPRSEETVARLREFVARPGPDYGELLRRGYAGAPAPPTRLASATRPDAAGSPGGDTPTRTREPRDPQQRGRRFFAALRGETVLGTRPQGTNNLMNDTTHPVQAVGLVSRAGGRPWLRRRPTLPRRGSMRSPRSTSACPSCPSPLRRAGHGHPRRRRNRGLVRRSCLSRLSGP